MKHKKGTYSLKDLVPLTIMFLITVIAISVGSQIIGGIAQSQGCNTGYTYNTTSGRCENTTSGFASGAGMTSAGNVSYAGLQGTQTFGNYLPTIAIVLAASIIVGILVSSFIMSGRN
jgi:hypothetical protein